MPNFCTYIRRARELPPRVVVWKAIQLVQRVVVGEVRKFQDYIVSPYGAPIDDRLNLAIRVTGEDVNERERQALAVLIPRYLTHRFDILGSGFVDVGYGAPVEGIEGVRYDVADRITAVREARDVWRLVPRSARRRSRSIYELIDDPDYVPIDWQRDMRSGFRWSARVHWQKLRIGRDRGADIKMPWELSRMQHLPQLAIAAVLSLNGESRFPDRARYVGEIRNQILDFLASNPPRFGAAWGCPMDVGIRLANWVVAIALVEGSGFELDKPFMSEFLAGVRDSASFIASNLEWAESGRSNHYLSDLIGLMYGAAALPRDAQSETWLHFSVRELCAEVAIQFHPDGGNYEGSTSYHRLSTELVLYGLALAAGLVGEGRDIFDRVDHATLALMRAPMPPYDMPIDDVLEAARRQLVPMLEFCKAIRRPDGDMVQIGDTDSGRLFKFAPPIEPSGNRDAFEECQLRLDDLIDGLCVLTCNEISWSSISASIVDQLSRGASTDDAPGGGKSRVVTDPGPESRPVPQEAREIRRLLGNLPAGSQRRWEIKLSEPVDGVIQLSQFPNFGLYCLRAKNFFLAFRCAGHFRLDAPSGHTHDDNLGLEIVSGGVKHIADPGTYVYTSFPELRNEYRLSSAHFVPRARERAVVEVSGYLFELRQVLRGRCICAEPHQLVGVLEGKGIRIMRSVEVRQETVIVHDGVEGGTLAPLQEPVFVARGYGKKTSQPSRLI